MLKSYLTIALRNLRRRRGYTLINVTGLALGLACCILLFIYVRSELAVDTIFADADRIYRVESVWKEETMGLRIVGPAPVGETMVRAYPEVEEQVRLWAGWINARVEGRPALRRNAYVADPNVLTFFDLPLLHGDAAALRGDRPVVIHERLARALFGTPDAVGRTVLLETYNNGEQPYTVTSVWRELPFNSFTNLSGPEDYELIVPMLPSEDFVTEAAWTSWENRYLLTYVKLAPGASAAGLQAKLDGFAEAYAPSPYPGNYRPVLESLRTVYLDGDGGQNRRAVWMLSGLAVLILLVACINFANLATAQALARAREVGVRKVLGARRGQLVRQFLGEAVLVCALAAAVGAGLAQVLQGPFFRLAGKPLVLEDAWDAWMVLALGGIAVVTGLLAGWYPGLVLSAFQPARTLKGSLRAGAGTAPLRRGLVVTQFALAVLLVASGYVVHRQLSFLGERSLGFDKEHVLAIESVPRDWTQAGVERLQAVKQRLAAVPGVQQVSLSFETAADGDGNMMPLRRMDQAPEEAVSLTRMVVDADYDETYGLDLKDGRFFEAGRAADSSGVVVNEQAVRALAIEGVGSTLVADDGSRWEVIGIVRDFHYTSLREPLRPLVMVSVEALPIYRMFSLRLAPGDVAGTLARVEAAWQATLPGAPFVHTFVDDQVAAMYETERRTRTVVALAAGLAVLIACLGMLGLVSISVVQRRKEIGVRKVLGASAARIVALFVKDFGVLVLVGVGCALPAAYVLAERWLADFAYRVPLGPLPFVLSGVLAATVALLAVSLQAFRAATADPVKALRHE